MKSLERLRSSLSTSIPAAIRKNRSNFATLMTWLLGLLFDCIAAIMACCASVISGNGTPMWRRAGRSIEHDLVEVAPAPAFRRIIGCDDRVLRHAEMFCRVPIWRLVAAPDMTAGAADAQM